MPTDNETPNLMENVFISPEGAEEQHEVEYTFRLTMTANGKYRFYADVKGKNYHKTQPMTHMFDTKADAMVALGEGMIIAGGMLSNPDKMIALMTKCLKG